jgi:hypothetical protein
VVERLAVGHLLTEDRLAEVVADACEVVTGVDTGGDGEDLVELFEGEALGL